MVVDVHAIRCSRPSPGLLGRRRPVIMLCLSRFLLEFLQQRKVLVDRMHDLRDPVARLPVNRLAYLSEQIIRIDVVELRLDLEDALLELM